MPSQAATQLLPLKFLQVALLVVLSLFFPALSSAGTSVKPIPVGVRVEAEGGGKGQGMWAQAANDLAPGELKTLESLVLSEIGKQEGVKIVSADYPEDFVAVVVVAAKLPNGRAGEWYIASSVVVVATKKGEDELLTHDVVAESDLASLAHSVGAYFATVRLRAALRVWK
jgi:hypothetical protein